MQTIVLETPGRFAATERPTPTRGPGDALVRVHRVGICGTDLHAFAGRQPFFTYPRVLGHELGVEVLDPGDDPSGLRAGDRCAVEPYLHCGRCRACRRGRTNCCEQLAVMGVHVDGGMRPLLAVPARQLHRSTVLDYDQLALVETLAIGAHAVARSRIGRGEVAAVVGAGPIGLGVAQFARAAGARVLMVDTNQSRLDFGREKFGLADAVNPTLRETKAALAELGDGGAPDVVFDATGSIASMETSFDLPGHGGRLVLVGLAQGRIAFDDPALHRRELDVLATRNALPQDFHTVIAALESGAVDTVPWITHRLALENVPARFAGLAREPALLKAVITVPPA